MLGNGKVWAIAQDKKHRIWVATSKGLYHFDRQTEKFTPYLENLDISSLAYDFDRNRLWIGTYEEGLYSISLESHPIKPLKVQLPKEELSKEKTFITRLAFRDNALWIGTQYQGLLIHQVAKGSWQNIKRSEGLPHLYIRGIDFTEDNQVYVGTDEGLVRGQFENGKFQLEKVFKHQRNSPSSISSNSIRCVYNDGFGHLWVGTRLEGVSRLSLEPPTTQQFTQESGDLPHGVVRALYPDSLGVLWVGTDGGGLVKLNVRNGQREFLASNGVLRDKAICAIYKDTQNRLWVGSRSGLAMKPAGSKQFKLFRYSLSNESSIPDQEIYSVAEDGDGNIWVGSREGVGIFQEETQSFKRINAQNSDLPYNDINTLLYDKARHLMWIGTYGRGLIYYSFEKKAFSYFLESEQEADMVFQNSSITYLTLDIGHSLWVSTYKDGVYKVDVENESFEQYVSAQGLASNTAFGVLQAENGLLWIPTTKGLSCFDPAFRSWKTFDTKDGFAINAFNYGGLVAMKNGYCFIRWGCLLSSG